MRWLPLWFCIFYAVTVLGGRVLWMRWRYGLERRAIYGGRSVGRAWRMVLVFHVTTLTILAHCVLWALGRLSPFSLLPVNDGTQIAGSALLLAGWILIVVAQSNMGSAWRLGIAKDATQLRTFGLFQYVRHPIYVGMMIVAGGLALMMPTPFMLCILVLAIVGLRREAVLEEDHLMQLHGEAYRTYCSQTGRWWPRLNSHPATTGSTTNCPP